MKRMLMITVVMIAAAIGFVPPIHAQVDAPVEFTTDFPFYIQNTKLPAGSYRIRQGDVEDVAFLHIESLDGGHSVFFDVIPTQKDEPHQHTDIIFHTYGGVDYLDRVWVEGDVTGVEVEPTKREKRLALTNTPVEHSVKGSGRHKA